VRPLPSFAWLVAGLALAAPATAQTSKRELDTLRAQLELPAQVKLVPATELVLPPARPLRVRLAFGLDLKARENVARWIEEWNRKDGARLGTVQVVEDGAAPVDVVLARVTDREKVRTRTVSGPDLGPSGPGTTSRSSTRSRFEIETIPVSAYVVDSRAAGQWTIVWRHTGFTTLEESGSSGRELWDGVKELMKKRKAAQ
jgi:hypothetical protein